MFDSHNLLPKAPPLGGAFFAKMTLAAFDNNLSPKNTQIV